MAARNNDLPDDHFYRIDSYDCYDNIGLWMEKPCIQFFNSVVTPSIMDFYPRVGVKRDESSRPDQKLYALRGLLSVEYVVVPQDKMSEFTEKWGAYGYVYDHEDASLVYFRNENYVPWALRTTNISCWKPRSPRRRREWTPPMRSRRRARRRTRYGRASPRLSH